MARLYAAVRMTHLCAAVRMTRYMCSRMTRLCAARVSVSFTVSLAAQVLGIAITLQEEKREML